MYRIICDVLRHSTTLSRNPSVTLLRSQAGDVTQVCSKGKSVLASTSTKCFSSTTRPQSIGDKLRGLRWQDVGQATLISGSLAGVGDLMAQTISVYEQGARPATADAPATTFDPLRMLRMLGFGTVYGPVQFYWYLLQEHVVKGRSAGAVILKVLSNQVALGPIVVGGTLCWNLLWLGRAEEVPDKLQHNFLRTWGMGACFWVPVSAIAFTFVPLRQRVLFFSACSVVFNAGLSYVLSINLRNPATSEALLEGQVTPAI